jgi:pimeloyl-ACP methyl ester carboxylesterase
MDVATLGTLPIGSSRRVRLTDASLHVWEAGDAGPPILLLHGIPTNHTLWWGVVPHLAGHARVLAVDLQGYGRSDRADRHAVDVAAQAGYVVELLDARGVERATVIGHDIGGGVGMDAFVAHVRALALVA